MRFIIYLLVLFSLSTNLIAQEKYLIYFIDKGPEQNTLSKNSAQWVSIESSLSEATIERRKKTLGENYITAEDIPIFKEYLTTLENNNINVIHKLKWFNAVSAMLTEDDIDFINSLEFVNKVERVKKFLKRKEIAQALKSTKDNNNNYITSTNYNLDYGTSLRQLEMSDIPIVHDLGITGNGVKIGVLDSGFRWKDHPALLNTDVKLEYDFVQKDGNTQNEKNDSPTQHNHGTFVFSEIGGKASGNLYGVSFNSEFYLAKTENVSVEQNVEEDNYAAALIWMEENGVDIATSSLGYNEFDSGQQSYTYADMNGVTTLVAKASNIAYDKGMVTITSAGNEGNKPWRYITSPGDALNVLTVGALSYMNNVAGFSSVGPTSDGRLKPEISANGVSVFGAHANSLDYDFSSGTSQAAPIVAGVAGLLLSTYPHLKNTQVRNIIMESGDNAETPDNEKGYGLVSALKAITFPNLQSSGNNYTINKIFYDSLGVNNSSIKIHYKSTNADELESSMLYDGSLTYSFELPNYMNGDLIDVYFTYEDNAGTVKRMPVAGKVFKLSYGKLDVALNKGLDARVPPNNHALYNNYPNPFNGTTKIDYFLNSGSNVVIKVYDIIGQEVKTLYRGFKTQGFHQINFNGNNIASGVYIYSLQVGDDLLTKKMLYLK